MTDTAKREKQLRQFEKHAQAVGYSHGYGLQEAKSLNAYYQSGWRLGREARRRFDEGNAE